MRGRHRRPRLGGHPQLRRGPHHALYGLLHQRRRAPRRPNRQAPSRHQPAEHGLFDQALHGPPLRRSRQRNQRSPLRSGLRWPRHGRGQNRWQGTHAAGNLGHDLAKDEADGRRLSGRGSATSRRHRPGVFQRRPTPSHQGRGHHRRLGGLAHRQRADRGGAGLRLRQGRHQRADRRVRPRRRHL